MGITGQVLRMCVSVVGGSSYIRGFNFPRPSLCVCVCCVSDHVCCEGLVAQVDQVTWCDSVLWNYVVLVFGVCAFVGVLLSLCGRVCFA